MFVDLLLIGKEGKRNYFLIKDFNIFMYDHILHRGKNIFAVITYKLSVQKKFEKVKLKSALTSIVNKRLRCL